jgi:transcriptional regulator
MKDSLYSPHSFVERDFDRLAAFLENHPFGTLISVDEGSPVVSHVPLLFERGAGTHGRLIGHLARANPHRRLLAKAEPVLVLFQGPHAYVSPSWYAEPGGVPTWNYAVVHVHGVAKPVEDGTATVEILRRMTAAYESRFPVPWQFDASDATHSRLLDMIVGLEIEATRIQGKFKLSQNRSPEDQSRIIEQLGQSGFPLDIGVLELMVSNLNRSS